MKQPKEKRRGGVFDDSVVHINFNREQLEKHLRDTLAKAIEEDKKQREKDEQHHTK